MGSHSAEIPVPRCPSEIWPGFQTWLKCANMEFSSLIAPATLPIHFSLGRIERAVLPYMLGVRSIELGESVVKKQTNKSVIGSF